MSKRVDNLLQLNVGQLREMLAHEDADVKLDEWLYQIDWETTFDYFKIDETKKIEDDFEDEDEDEDDFEDDEVCGWKKDVDDSHNIPLQDEYDEDTARKIAEDILDGKYTIDIVRGLYSEEVINRIEYLTN